MTVQPQDSTRVPIITWGKRAVTSQNAMYFWVLVALVLTVGSGVATLDGPFVGPHAWVSAHFSVMARTFVDSGLTVLGPLPIQNNPPQGTSPDGYTHWPPLFPLLLAVVFKSVGESEASARGFVLLIVLANSFALAFLLRPALRLVAVLFAVFAYLCLPVLLKYGDLVAHLHLAIFWMLVSLGAFLRATGGSRIRVGWAAAGLVTMFLAVLSSWEPVIACLGLLVAGLWTRRREMIRLALWYCAIAAGTATAVIAVYMAMDPSLLSELWHVFLFRIGAVPTHHIGTISERPSLLDVIMTYWWRLNLLGPLGTLSAASVLLTGWFLKRRQYNHRATTLFCGLFAPPIIWYVFFWGHAFPHGYEMLLVAPAVAASVGLCMGWLAGLFARYYSQIDVRHVLSICLFILLPLVMLRPLVVNVRERIVEPESDTAILQHSLAIRSGTEPGSVVISPHRSRVVTYYSERRIIHGVDHDS
ncbi:MAG: hypothetical protein O7D32_07730, partial [bacterium]|nr:hypothetical protein [bacterium]